MDWALKDMRRALREVERERLKLNRARWGVAVCGAAVAVLIPLWILTIRWGVEDMGVVDKGNAMVPAVFGLLLFTFAGLAGLAYHSGELSCAADRLREARWEYEDACDTAAQ